MEYVVFFFLKQVIGIKIVVWKYALETFVMVRSMLIGLGIRFYVLLSLVHA